MKQICSDKIEQCKEAINMYLSNIPANNHSQVSVSSLIKAIRESSFSGMKDLNMSHGTFRKHFGALQIIKQRCNMASRSANWPIQRSDNIGVVFYEILCNLEPNEILRISLKDLRSMAIERYPHLSIESKALSTLRQYFRITELKLKALNTKLVSSGIAR